MKTFETTFCQAYKDTTSFSSVLHKCGGQKYIMNELQASTAKMETLTLSHKTRVVKHPHKIICRRLSKSFSFRLDLCSAEGLWETTEKTSLDQQHQKQTIHNMQQALAGTG